MMKVEKDLSGESELEHSPSFSSGHTDISGLHLQQMLQNIPRGELQSTIESVRDHRQVVSKPNNLQKKAAKRV